MRRHLVLWSVLATCVLVVLILSGCTGVSTATENPGTGSADGDEVSGPVGDTEPEQSMEESSEEVESKDYGVPAEAADVVNPVPADEASLQEGEEIYKSICINCHGEEGRGDGVAGVKLDPPPNDFRAEQVKQLSDGEMFYIITNGVEGANMPSWEFFEEERRWHLVNYIRSLQE